MIVTGVELGDHYNQELTEYLNTLYGKEEVNFFPIEYTDFGGGEAKFRLTDGFDEERGEYKNPVELRKRIEDGEKIALVIRGESGDKWNSSELFTQTRFLLGKLKKEGAEKKNLCTITPCQPFSRQDREYNEGEVVSLKEYRDMVREYSKRSFTVSVHDHREEGFIDEEKTLYNIDAFPLARRNIERVLGEKGLENSFLIAPDEGSLRSIESIAEKFEPKLPVVRLYKDKDSKGRVTVSRFWNEEDRKKLEKGEYKTGVNIDDMIFTGGTQYHSNQCIIDQGRRVITTVVHGIAINNALDMLGDQIGKENIYVSDTVKCPLPEENIYRTTQKTADAIIEFGFE